MPLKLVWSGKGEWNISGVGTRLTIGRHPKQDIRLEDGMCSGKHAVIANGFLTDVGSTNGTVLNGKPLAKNRKAKLKKDDVITVGQCKLKIKDGQASSDELSKSKRFGGMDPAELKEKEEEAKLSVEELMDKEFGKIIGMESVKKQLNMFYKKVQLDEIRAKNNKLTDTKRLYHMIFTGSPGTGKTTMANLVAKIMVKMKLIKTDKVVFVNNALDLLAGYAGQTPGKVDAKVAEAEGGVIFIDEAYSVVKSDKHLKDSFGKEAIETIMKHLDPPSAVFIFAGYEKEMEGFLKVNQGMARRIPFRFNFENYSPGQLGEIFAKMVEGKGEVLSQEASDELIALIESINEQQRSTQNAGLMNNWLSFAQLERDDRIDIKDAEENPALASLLEVEDLQAALTKVGEMQLKEPN